jgi:hypothetical protein
MRTAPQGTSRQSANRRDSFGKWALNACGCMTTISSTSSAMILSERIRAYIAPVDALRNRYAHAIRYDPAVSEITTLFSSAALAFTDYSDGIKEGIVELSSGRLLDLQNRWLLGELFSAIVYDLHQEFVARGGDEGRP